MSKTKSHYMGIEEKLAIAIEALEVAAEAFRRYEAHHAAKPDPEKAKTNGLLADIMDLALECIEELE